jgi:hypothetical protein
MSTDSKARSLLVLNRPLTVIVAIVGQFVIAGHLLLPGVLYVRYGGLRVIADPEVLLGVISAISLLRKGDFGWWFALITDLLWVAAVLHGEGAVNWDAAALLMLPLSVVVLLLMPSARNFYCTTNITSLRIHPS